MQQFWAQMNFMLQFSKVKAKEEGGKQEKR